MPMPSIILKRQSLMVFTVSLRIEECVRMSEVRMKRAFLLAVRSHTTDSTFQNLPINRAPLNYLYFFAVTSFRKPKK